MGHRIAQLILVVLLLFRPAVAEEQRTKTMADCITIALEQQPTLGAATSAVQAGNQRVWQATANYLPQVTGFYNAARRYSSATVRTGVEVTGVSETSNFFSTGVALSQVLFDFGQNLNNIRAAQASQRALEADAATQRASTTFNVKQAYYTLLAAQRLTRVAAETMQQNQQYLQQAEGRVRLGLAARFDMTQTKVQVNDTKLDQINAQNNLELAREVLRDAMALPGELDFEIADTLEAPPLVIDEPSALATAYEQRPEMQSIQAQRFANDEQIAALQKSYLPYVAGNATYYWANIDHPLDENWDVGASVVLPLFTGGLTTARIGEAKANLSTLQFNEAALRQSINLEVRQALINVRQAERRIKVTQEGVDDARDNVALANGRYKTGLADVIELTTAQESLTTSEANRVQALAAYRIAVAALERAIGQDLLPQGP